MGRTSDAKDRLIASALELIYARSYQDVGVQEICDHAGVKKGSFYHFFPSKRDLTLAALDTFWERYESDFLVPTFADSRSPLERIRRFFAAGYRHQCNLKKQGGSMLGCPFGNLAVEMSTQDEVLRERLGLFFERSARYLEGALVEARDAGQIDSPDPAADARALLAFQEGSVLLAKTQNDPEMLNSLGEKALKLVGGAAEI